MDSGASHHRQNSHDEAKLGLRPVGESKTICGWFWEGGRGRCGVWKHASDTRFAAVRNLSEHEPAGVEIWNGLSPNMGPGTQFSAASKIQDVPKIRFVVATRESQEGFFTKTATGRSLSLFRLPFVELILYEQNTRVCRAYITKRSIRRVMIRLFWSSFTTTLVYVTSFG